jgi:3-hydroxyisobutyrate dehydrogenase
MLTDDPLHVPSVGFVGLGSMGGALAGRLAKTGKVSVFDIDATRVAALVELGGTARSSLIDLAEECDVILLCLPTSDHVEETVLGEASLTSVPSKLKLVVDMTSGDPQKTRCIAARASEAGVTVIDAPVSGGPSAAVAGTITIMVGASDVVYTEVRPVLERITSAITHVGPVGTGHTLKLINNTMAAANRLIAFQGAAAAVREGIPVGVFLDVVNHSSGRNSATEVTFPQFVLGDHLTQGFSLKLMLKDVTLGAELMHAGLPQEMSMASATREALSFAANDVAEGADLNAVLRIYERAMSVEVAAERLAAD